MSQRERGKAKALRIDMNYYRRRTWLGTWRGIAATTGLIAAALYGAWVLSLGGRQAPASDTGRAAHLSTGPLALVHAHFESDCESCHSEKIGIALAHDAWQAAPEQRLQLQAAKCQDCHYAAGHAQGMLAQPELDRDCARCHRDHLGRENLLASVPQKICTDCHADLAAACARDVRPKLAAAVADFSIQSHGIESHDTQSRDVEVAAADASKLQSEVWQASVVQFRSLLKDRGRVRFDHAQHLQAGQVDPDSKGGFQLGMLSPGLREVYGEAGQPDSSLVQLKCSNCHVPYAIQDAAGSSATARAEGRFYAPVKFEKHCAACHQLSFAGQSEKQLSLPHVAQREEFASLLRAKQFAGTLGGKVVSPGDAALEKRESAGRDGTSQPVELAQAKVEAAVDAVFARCQQCHLEEDTRPPVIARALAGTLEPLIPRRWLQHGSFDHAAHAGITRCAYCHPMPSAVGAAVDNQRVLIRGPESCVPCHRAPGAEVPPEFATPAKRRETLGQKNQPTWASETCTTCHRYHWSRSSPQADGRVAGSQ